MRAATPAAMAVLLGLAACGGGSAGGNDPAPPLPPPMTQAEAYRFLNQATFGATREDAQRVIDMGIAAWIDEQLETPPSLQLPHLQALPLPRLMGELQADRVDIWFRNVLHGEDQLRQRVAFALSEIMVVSQLGALANQPYALASYYDTLARNAFGNYRELLEAVTLHPAMGVYLSMLGNQKPDPVNNIRPDENFARELMQLFSIGLVALNQDGSEKRDAEGQPIPTYDQSVIEGFAHVYTGWTYARATDFRDVIPTPARQVLPMELWPEYHDAGAKRLLNNVTLPTGQTGEQDLAAALDNVFGHPNVAPFIATRLLQRLVTSNPSPDYVSRVAAVFEADSRGVRGNLGAVAKAILLDPEARPAANTEIDGKLKEPLLRLTQLWRSYDAASASGRYAYNFIHILFGQGPLQAAHVFNFFSPFYAPPGEIRDAGLVAPELEIATEYQNTLITNFAFCQAFFWNQTRDETCGPVTDDTVLIDTTEEVAASGDIQALVDLVADKLMAGQVSATLRDETVGMIGRIPAEQREFRAAEAIYLIVTSPEFAYQR